MINEEETFLNLSIKINKTSNIIFLKLYDKNK